MDFLQAIVLGIVEGLTEFLPISSTGHLILATKLLGITSTDFVKSFEIFIQSGAILAVIFFYWTTLMSRKDLLLKIFTAFIPTAIIGLIFYSFIKTYLLGNVTVVLWSMFLGGIALILIEIWLKKHPNLKESNESELGAITYRQSFLIGLVQSISIIPGVSRSAASIIGGMAFGLSRKHAVEFSFLLAVPTLMAATGLDLVKTNFSFSSNEWMLLSVGFIVSFIVSALSIKLLIAYVKKYTFVPFGVYRIVISIILFAVFFLL